MAKVYIHGEIGRNWWNDEAVSLKSFKKEFDAAVALAEEKGESIDVHINSPGGSVYEGIAIYNHIVNSGKDVNTIIDGIAFSMGAIIAMAGTKVKAAKNSTMLLHNCWGGAMGNASDLEQTVEHMKALDDNLIGTVANKTGLTTEDVTAKWFDYKDHTLTATQAKDAGLIDELLGEAEDVPTGSVEEIFAHFRTKNKEDKSIIGRIQKAITDAAAKMSSSSAQPQPTTKMNIQDQLNLLVSAESSEEVRASARKAIEDSFGAEETFTTAEVATQVANAVSTAKTAKDAEISALQAKVTTLEAKVVVEPTATGASADGVSGGVLTPEQELEALAKADQEAINLDYK